MRARLAAILLVSCLPAWCQQRITLTEAVAIALKNNPRLALDHIGTQIAEEITAEVRSGLFPTLTAATTAAGATADSRLAAGALNNPIIFNRYAAGAIVNQLITDFGRTTNLVEGSRLRTRAQNQSLEVSRAQITLAVHQTYFAGLRAVGLLRVAEQTAQARALAVEQVTALAKSNLKSTLDVSFAEVNHSEAKLALLAAANEHRVALASLSLVLGYSRPQRFELEDVPPSDQAPPAAEELIAEATANRPEVAALRLEREAAVRTAAAERKLAMPTISAQANAGVAPIHDDRLKNRYAAAALNLSVPVFNGGLFHARRREAELRVQAIDQRLRELENQIARDTATALLDAQTAFERIALTDQLRGQATVSAELAQERYNLGLSSIVELSLAQLNQTAAEIRSASARYDYLARRSVVEYQAGRLR